MPKTRQQKQDVYKKLVDELRTAKSASLVSFTAIPVNLDQKLREEMYNEKISYGVVKKTLLRKSFEELNFDTEWLLKLNGNVSIAISKYDEVAPAKIISMFIKKNERMEIAGGILENKWIDKVKVETLAKLPCKKELFAIVVGTIKSPLNGIVNVLAANIRGLINALNGIKNVK